VRVRAAAAAIVGLAAVGLHAQQETASPPPELPSSVWGGAYTEPQARRGEAVYRQECASCHGSALTGGEEAGALAGPVFTANWNGVTVGDLFDRTRMSMPQNRPGRLTRQQMADVLAYIFSMNRFPAGKTELPRESERLKMIRFEATRP
jgi:mono/diheme cytochrome c family protein